MSPPEGRDDSPALLCALQGLAGAQLVAHSQELVRKMLREMWPIKVPGEAEVNFPLNVIIINIIMDTPDCSELFASHHSTFIALCPMIAWYHVLYTACKSNASPNHS